MAAKQRFNKGATGIAYGLLVGLVAVVALGAISSSGSSVDSLMTDVAGTMQDVSTSSTSGGSGGGSATPTPAPTATASPTPDTFTGTIEMPSTGAVMGYSTYWQCNGNGMRTTTRVILTEHCENPTIAIHQNESADASIHGSYYILDAAESVIGTSPYQTHGSCNTQPGRWCTPTQFNSLTLQANTYYHLGFQNGQGVCDMSGPSVFPDDNARTVGIATFDEPRVDDPNTNSYGRPSSSAGWQNRWQIICE